MSNSEERDTLAVDSLQSLWEESGDGMDGDGGGPQNIQHYPTLLGGKNAPVMASSFRELMGTLINHGIWGMFSKDISMGNSTSHALNFSRGW